MDTDALPPSPAFDYESELEACARGDAAALRRLYERDGRWLLGVALRIVRNRERAHEVLQDAFLAIWNQAGSYQRALGSARGWIYTVLRHRALDEVRRSTREAALSEQLHHLADLAPAHDAAHDPAGDTALDRCLEQLDPKRRDCIVQAFVGGLTYAQIASAQQVPLATVKSWMRRSLLALKACLS